MKKIIGLISLVLMLGCLTGCVNEDEKTQYEKLAKKNALNYIEEKYDIKAKVVLAKAQVSGYDKFGVIADSLTGDVLVTLKYKEKEFDVMITGKEKSIDGKDNFQLETIQKDILNIVKKDINFEIYDYSISIDSNNLIKEYYNGNNLKEILSEGISLKLYLIGYDSLEIINFNQLNNVINQNDSIISVINFNSTENYNTYIKTYKETETILSDKFYGMYIDSYLTIVNGKREYNKFNIIESNALYFYGDNNIILTETTIDNIDGFKSNNANSVIRVMDSYLINKSNSESLLIYIPINKISLEYDNLIVGTECYDYGKNNNMQTVDKLRKIGEYYVGVIPNWCGNDEVKFTILQENQ